MGIAVRLRPAAVMLLAIVAALLFIAFEQTVFLTDQQYEELLAERREHLDRTHGWDTLIGCPGCWLGRRHLA